MSLVKRNIGRRVAGVGVAVALMVLGLQAPASAAVTITALSPTSGPPGCVVVATGTGFRDFPAAQTTVNFVSGATVVAAPNFFAFSDGLTLWVEAPAALVPGTAYNLRVDNPGTTDPGITSTATFLATTGSGGCAPTITSFTPTCGLANSVVVITGTNLIDGSSLLGGEVRFSPYAVGQIATHTVPDVDDVTSLSVLVPTGSADGPISVDTDVGAPVFSTTNFLVPPPDCPPVTGNEHARSITFKIKKSGAASGVVSSTEDPAFTDCAAAVPVKIQRKTSGGWKTVGKTTTDDSGAYAKKVKNKKGKQKFRALAPKVSLGDPVTDVCLKAKSATRTA
jgi:hypothetical protein